MYRINYDDYDNSGRKNLWRERFNTPYRHPPGAVQAVTSGRLLPLNEEFIPIDDTISSYPPSEELWGADLTINVPYQQPTVNAPSHEAPRLSYPTYDVEEMWRQDFEMFFGRPPRRFHESTREFAQPAESEVSSMETLTDVSETFEAGNSDDPNTEANPYLENEYMPSMRFYMEDSGELLSLFDGIGSRRLHPKDERIPLSRLTAYSKLILSWTSCPLLGLDIEQEFQKGWGQTKRIPISRVPIASPLADGKSFEDLYRIKIKGPTVPGPVLVQKAPVVIPPTVKMSPPTDPATKVGGRYTV